MELHVYQGYPLFLQEAIDRWHSYPPPCYGYYIIPWLWFDGNPRGGSNPASWDDSILARMTSPSPVSITAWGYYSPVSGNGMIYSRFRNDSTGAINARALFAITEDSIYYPAPNADSIHNHVVRDYLPDHIGADVSVLPGDSVTISRPFSVLPAWDPSNCLLVTVLQDTLLRPDSTKDVIQCGLTRLTDLEIEEQTDRAAITEPVTARSNPAARPVVFTINLAAGTKYDLKIHDSAGRLIRSIRGMAPRTTFSVTWDLKDQSERAACPGVYFYALAAAGGSWRGKLIVK